MNLKVLGILAGIVLAAIVLWPSGSSQKVKTLFEEGEQLYQAKKYQGATAKYQEALAEAGKRGVDTKIIDKDFESLVKYKIALAYAELAKQTEDVSLYDKSLEYVQEVYQRASVKKHKAAVVFLWGHVLYQQEEYEEAELKFKELIDFYSDSRFVENAYYMIGKLNFALARYEPSRLGFKAVVNHFPTSQFIDDAQYLIAQSYLVEQNYEQAFNEFDKMTLEKFPNHPELADEAQYKAAYSLLQLGRNDDAIAMYNSFITQFPQSRYVTTAYFDIGTIYTKLKNYDQARQNYELAILNTKDEALQAEIQFEIGENYFDQEDYDNAILSYQKLVDTYPNSKLVGYSRFAIAESYMKKKDYDNAIKVYQEVLDKHPDSRSVAYSTFQIGEAHYQKKEHQTALSWYQKVLDKYSDQSIAIDALYGAIWCLSQLGRDDEAQKLVNDFIAKMRQDPRYDLAAAEVQMKLGDIQFDQEHYDRAAVEYGKVISEYKDLPKFNALKCRSLFQQGFSYYKTAATKNMEAETLKKAIAAYEDLLDRFSHLDMGWRSKPKFNVAEYDFQERAALVENAIFNLVSAYKELEDWEKVIFFGDYIINTYSNSQEKSEQKVIKLVSELVDQARSRLEKKRWGTALAADNISAYEEFLRGKHPPASVFIEQARTRLKQLYALRDWKQAQSIDTIEAYEKFLKEHPESEFADQARSLIEGLQKELTLWEQVQKAGTIQAYKRFIAENPENPYIEKAKALIAEYEADMTGRDVVDALQRGKIEVEATGSGIETVTLRIKRLVNHRIRVLIPIGTFFVCRGAAQNMVARGEETAVLDNDNWQTIIVEAACANRTRDIPGTVNSFDIQLSPHQEELKRLMPVLQKARASFGVEQATVWIVTDNADYDDLGILVSRSQFQVFGGTRVIKEYEAAMAMKICDEAGIDITKRAIWQDRNKIIQGLQDENLKKWILKKEQD